MNIRIAPRILLIGPYDPHCGEYTFLAPPLGVWRLAGVLRSAGLDAKVFDPNCCRETPQRALERELSSGVWDVVGCSTTGMTLRFDLELAYLARRTAPQALIVAGGMEATFRPQLMFELGPFDLVILGEGERPLLEIAARLRAGQPLAGMRGTAQRTAGGELVSIPQAAFRSVRLSTLNYCPMNCSFCSATNFLQEAQGSVAPVARLDADECLAMIERILAAHPRTRTIIFQDDIFMFTRDRRVLALCDAIVEAKRCGKIPPPLQFISTNRIDAVSEERLAALKRAGFRVLGFGIESFSPRVLQEFNKGHIHRFIEPMLSAALAAGITPFLDIILSSPRATLEDVVETLRGAYAWLRRGCEIGMYPYVIPFSGAAFSRDPELLPHTRHARRQVTGTAIAWDQPAKILPVDPVVREVILRMERGFESSLESLERHAAHLPSRVRSLLWILSAIPVLAELGQSIADESEVRAELCARLPALQPEVALAAAVAT